MALIVILFVLTTTSSWAQWSQTATLTASDGQSGDTFSRPMAIDGNTLVLGAFSHNQFAGSAYVFTESNGVWTQVAELAASDAVGGIAFGSLISNHLVDDPCAAIPQGFLESCWDIRSKKGGQSHTQAGLCRLGEPEALMRKRLVYSNVYSAGEEAEEYAANKTH